MYPNGVETDVLLDGAVKKKKGTRLTEEDFFRTHKEKTMTEVVLEHADETYTPYHLPNGFESVNDKDYGIVFVACGDKTDCIIKEEADAYRLYVGDKKFLTKAYLGDFSTCIQKAVNLMGEIKTSDRPISNLQIRLLAPEYPTNTLTWDGANCILCWKTWKKVIIREGKRT